MGKSQGTNRENGLIPQATSKTNVCFTALFANFHFNGQYWDSLSGLWLKGSICSMLHWILPDSTRREILPLQWKYTWQVKIRRSTPVLTFTWPLCQQPSATPSVIAALLQAIPSSLPNPGLPGNGKQLASETIFCSPIETMKIR